MAMLTRSLVLRHTDLPGDLAECAIERFAEANFARINNKSGFLMVRDRFTSASSGACWNTCLSS